MKFKVEKQFPGLINMVQACAQIHKQQQQPKGVSNTTCEQE